MADIRIFKTPFPLVAWILEDWRGLYTSCKARRLQILLLPEELKQLRALADSFFQAFAEHPRVTWDEGVYQLRSSVLVQGATQVFRFPFDLFIAESYAEILPPLARRLRNTPSLDEGAVIDLIAAALQQATVPLKKNDVRIITLLSDPDFLGRTNYWFPTEEQLARTLGVAEATAQGRLMRLLDAAVMQLHYWRHPRSVGFGLAICEQAWPLQGKNHTMPVVAFEFAPQKGVTVQLQTAASTAASTARWSVTELVYAVNLAQLAQWNQPSWSDYPPVTNAMKETPAASHVVSVDLTTPPSSELTASDRTILRLLQETAGRDLPRFERETGLPITDLDAKVRTLVEAHHCYPLLELQRLGFQNIFVYLDGEADQVAMLQQNLRWFPILWLFRRQTRLVAVVQLPEQWVYRFATDLERLKLAGWRLFYRVATPASYFDPWRLSSVESANGAQSPEEA